MYQIDMLRHERTQEKVYLQRMYIKKLILSIIPNLKTLANYSRIISEHCSIPIIANGGSSNNRHSPINTHQGDRSIEQRATLQIYLVTLRIGIEIYCQFFSHYANRRSRIRVRGTFHYMNFDKTFRHFFPHNSALLAHQ